MKDYQDTVERKLKLEEEREQERIRRHEEMRFKLELQREERIMRKLEGNQKTKQVIHSKPLYLQIQERYHSNVEMVEQAKFQEQLEKRKALYKPLERQEIEEHAMRHRENLDEMENLLYNQRKGNQVGPNLGYEKKMKSKFMEQVLREDKESKKQLEKIRDDKMRMKDKKYSYSKYVKEIHWPEISSRKQEELEAKISQIKHPVRYPKNNQNDYIGFSPQKLYNRSISQEKLNGNRQLYQINCGSMKQLSNEKSVKTPSHRQMSMNNKKIDVLYEERGEDDDEEYDNDQDIQQIQEKLNKLQYL